jgi:hypothetical protein
LQFPPVRTKIGWAGKLVLCSSFVTLGDNTTKKEEIMAISQENSKRLLNWLAVVLTLSILVSCSSKPENAIVGKWSEIGGTETMEFFKDGTVSVVDKGMTMEGSYKFVEKDSIKLELGGLGALVGPIVAKVSIKGDELIFTLPDGDVLKYKRAK